jgi:hypothetical protein
MGKTDPRYENILTLTCNSMILYFIYFETISLLSIKIETCSSIVQPQ